MATRSNCGTGGVGRSLGVASIALLVGVAGLVWTSPADAGGERAGYFTYVTDSKTAPAREQTSERAVCPPGTVVVGGGVYTTGSTLADEVASSGPFDGPDADRRPDDGWFGEVNTGPVDARIDTHAVCAPFLGMTYARKTISVAPGDEAGAEVGCPSRAPDLFGGGAITRGKSTKVTLARSIGDASLGGGYAWRSGVNNGRAKETTVVAFAICGDPSTSGHSLAKNNSPAPPGQTSQEALCLESDQVSGGGVTIVAPGLQGEIASLIPVDSKDPGLAPDDGWKAWTNNHTTADQPRTVTAVCHP